MGHGLGEFEALAHAPAVAADEAVAVAGQLDEFQGPPGLDRGLLAGSAVKEKKPVEEIPSGHVLVEGVLLGTETEARKEGRVVPDRPAVDQDDADARPQLPGQELHEGRFAGPVRPEQAGDARLDVQGHVREAKHVAIPFAELVGADAGGHRMTSTPLTLRSRTKTAAPDRAASTKAE